MKKIIMFSLIALPLLLNACQSSTHTGEENLAQFHAVDTNNLTKGAVFYQCSMHPDQISDSLANCPVCEHDLIKTEKK